MRNKLYGAILGDLAGQPYEYQPNKYKKKFQIHNPDSEFTDDTILTLAGAYSMMHNAPIETCYRNFGKRYPDRGFGKGFLAWLATEDGTKGDSYGNGCIMRLSPFMYGQDALKDSIHSCITSHNHEESLISVIRLMNLYGGNYPNKVRKPKKFTAFSSKAIDSIGFCENVFLYTKSTHQAIETAVKMKGDTDTHGSIVGELSNYTYDDLTSADVKYVESKLDTFLLKILKDFNNG